MFGPYFSCCRFLWVFCAIVNLGFCDEWGGDHVEDVSNESTLFVSLGSYCGPAVVTRCYGLRKAAFPLDWAISFDGEQLIRLITDDFLYFFDKEFLVVEPEGTLINTFYRLQFPHDGPWLGDNFFESMKNFQAKYSRRLARFRKLADHPGKVFFMRSAYFASDRNNYFYPSSENIEITEEYSRRLFDALEYQFPSLDFSLIIVNNHDRESVLEEKRISDRLIMIRAPADTNSIVFSPYKEFFHQLENEESKKRVAQ